VSLRMNSFREATRRWFPLTSSRLVCRRGRSENRPTQFPPQNNLLDPPFSNGGRHQSPVNCARHNHSSGRRSERPCWLPGRGGSDEVVGDAALAAPCGPSGPRAHPLGPGRRRGGLGGLNLAALESAAAGRAGGWSGDGISLGAQGGGNRWAARAPKGGAAPGLLLRRSPRGTGKHGLGPRRGRRRDQRRRPAAGTAWPRDDLDHPGAGTLREAGLTSWPGLAAARGRGLADSAGHAADTPRPHGAELAGACRGAGRRGGAVRRPATPCRWPRVGRAGPPLRRWSQGTLAASGGTRGTPRSGARGWTGLRASRWNQRRGSAR